MHWPFFFFSGLKHQPFTWNLLQSPTCENVLQLGNVCVCVCRKWPFVLPRFACRAVCHQTALCCGYSANHQHAQWLGGLSQTGCIWRIKSKRHTHTHKHTLENWFLLKFFGKAEGLLCVCLYCTCVWHYTSTQCTANTLCLFTHISKSIDEVWLVL